MLSTARVHEDHAAIFCVGVPLAICLENEGAVSCIKGQSDRRPNYSRADRDGSTDCAVPTLPQSPARVFRILTFRAPAGRSATRKTTEFASNARTDNLDSEYECTRALQCKTIATAMCDERYRFSKTCEVLRQRGESTRKVGQGQSAESRLLGALELAQFLVAERTRHAGLTFR